MRRSGFTLLEVLVAIVLTSVVALLAYGTARTGIDTGERLARYRGEVETQAIVRALLVDALRHPPEQGGGFMNDVLFGLDDRMSREGLPLDGLQFFTRGALPPLGATDTWFVSLEPSEAGLRVRALPADTASAAPIELLWSGVHGLNVRVLGRTADSVWIEQWDLTGRVPAAVALEFLDEQGRYHAPPLIVHAALDQVR